MLPDTVQVTLTRKSLTSIVPTVGFLDRKMPTVAFLNLKFAYCSHFFWKNGLQ